MLQTLSRFFSILCFIFSGVGLLAMMAETVLTGRLMDGGGSVPPIIRMLMYIGSAVLGAALQHIALEQQDQKKQK